MIEPIRLDESRVVNGWIKTTEDGYVSEDEISQFLIQQEEDSGEKYFSIGALTVGNRFGCAEVGYYPYDTNAEKANAEEMAKQDLDAFVAKHGKLF